VTIQRFDNEDALAAALAARVLDAIVANPQLVLGLATGRTPLAFYRELRERSDQIDWSGVRTFNLDEFAGLDGNHPGSYRAFMQAELFDHVAIDPGNVGIPNGRAADLKAECRRYEDAIAALAPLVDGARADGDLVAAEIMIEAADELASAAASVISRLEMRGEQFPILLAGGILKRSEWLAAEVARRMAEVAPRSEVRPLTHEPALGAVRLALAEARGGVRVPPYIDAFRATPQ